MYANIRNLLFVALTGLLLAAGCAKKQDKPVEKPLARVYDRYLFRSDVKDVVPPGLKGEDSAKVVKDYVEKWIRNRLLLSKAEQNLTDSEKDVEQQIESYRSSLLIYAYQQSYIRQKLDTVVTDEEVAQYYKDNQPNFILSAPLMKGVFIKVPVSAPETGKVRQWYRSESPENIRNLEAYCFKYAKAYDHFNDGWIRVSEVLPMIPSAEGSSEQALVSRRYIEMHDKDFLYFLYAKEIIPAGTVSPLETVKKDIHSIILNKRKIKLINELETSIFNDAQNREQFTIYP
jgi:hypothetical protein